MEFCCSTLLLRRTLAWFCQVDVAANPQPLACRIGIPLVDKRLQHLRSLRIDAEAALCLSKEHMKEGRPKSYGASAFTVGDKVWLQAKQIKIHQQSAKLGPKQLGPFEITEVISDMDYRLALPLALKIHDVFHVDCKGVHSLMPDLGLFSGWRTCYLCRSGFHQRCDLTR